MIIKIFHINAIIIKYLIVGFLCLFFTGFANVTYQYLQPNDNHENSYCCCAGEVVEDCSCTGSCCSLGSEFTLSISKRACSQTERIETMLIKFEFLVDPSEYLNTYPNTNNRFSVFKATKGIPFVALIEKPPQNYFKS